MFQNNKMFQLVCRYNVLILLFVFISSFSFGQTNSIQEIRQTLNKAQHDEAIAKQIYTALENRNSKNPTVQALEASATAVMALHVGNPMKKLKYAKSAAAKIDKVIAKHPSLLEARLIRFSIESKAPAFLGLSKNVSEDAAFLRNNFSKENLKGIPTVSQKEYLNIFKESKEFSNTELEQFQQEIN